MYSYLVEAELVIPSGGVISREISRLNYHYRDD